MELVSALNITNAVLHDVVKFRLEDSYETGLENRDYILFIFLCYYFYLILILKISGGRS
jgi:hypothetical protein